jgi:hypothetical protein
MEERKVHTRANARFSLVLPMLLVVGLIASCGGSSARSSPPTPTPTPTLSPTPILTAFTVVAFPSDVRPANHEHVTIYVICTTSPSSQTGQHPLANVTVDIKVGSPVNLEISPKPVTDAKGRASGEFVLEDAHPGQPVLVTITAIYAGMTETTQTFFTPK